MVSIGIWLVIYPSCELVGAKFNEAYYHHKPGICKITPESASEHRRFCVSYGVILKNNFASVDLSHPPH